MIYLTISLSQWPANFSPNPNNYPFGPLKNSPVVVDNGYNYVTAYFVDPCKYELSDWRKTYIFGIVSNADFNHSKVFNDKDSI
jgi:hypothetical protein